MMVLRQTSVIASAALTLWVYWPGYAAVVLVLLRDGLDAASHGLAFALYTFLLLYAFLLAFLSLVLGVIPARHLADARPGPWQAWLVPLPALPLAALAWLTPDALAGTAQGPWIHVMQWLLLCLTFQLQRWRLAPNAGAPRDDLTSG